MANRGFQGTLTDAEKNELAQQATACRGDILKMTTIAASGHPGGSMSSIDMYLTLYKFANISPENKYDLSRDRIFVSHGHTSPGVYSTLAQNGFFDIDEAISGFRLAGSIYEGHIERMVPGVEWTTGNLGQGLSAACGAAIAGKIAGNEFDVFVLMGDGEQQKGQISEGRRFAVQHGLNNITLFIDYNKLQISGNIEDVMKQNLKAEYEADGWKVIEIDGHDYDAIYNAVVEGKACDAPVMVLANTIMGKGISFMENIAGYHGKPLTDDQLAEALTELGLENDMDKLNNLRANYKIDLAAHKIHNPEMNIAVPAPKTYGADVKTDNRSAFGDAVLDLVKECADRKSTPIAVFDCDLAGSVKTDGVMKHCPEYFVQSGIQEHHTATCAGAASVNGVVSFFADFGVFGVDEVYNQQRLNDINEANIKVGTTHVGMDVGEDGKTHQCLDYVGAMNNIFGFKVLVPGDANQTYRAVQYAAANEGNFLIAMGRSKLATVTNEAGEPMFGGDYQFEYGKVDVVKDGDVAIVTYGAMLPYALQAAEILAEKGIKAAVLNTATPAAPDMDVINKYADKGILFTYEDHNANTGVGAVLANKFCEEGKGVKIVKFGATEYAFSGKPGDIFKLMGIDPQSVADKIASAVK